MCTWSTTTMIQVLPSISISLTYPVSLCDHLSWLHELIKRQLADCGIEWVDVQPDHNGCVWLPLGVSAGLNSHSMDGNGAVLYTEGGKATLMEVEDFLFLCPFIPLSLPFCRVSCLFHMLFIGNNELTPFPHPEVLTLGRRRGLWKTESASVCDALCESVLLWGPK